MRRLPHETAKVYRQEIMRMVKITKELIRDLESMAQQHPDMASDLAEEIDRQRADLKEYQQQLDKPEKLL